MAPKANFDLHSRIWFRLSLLLFFISSTVAVAVHGQTATYHLHAENSAGIYQLKTAGPDAPSSVLKSINLKNAANGEYVIAPFLTLSGDPNAGGVIPAGSVVSVSLWLRKSATAGTMFPRAKLTLNTATGTSICVLTGSTALTTTLTKYTLTGTVSTNISVSASDRFHLWVGVNLTAKSNQINQAELNIEGTLNGNHDSLLTVPLPIPPPTISSISPNAAPIGTSIVITGTGFGATQGASTVTFLPNITATPTSWSNTSITVPVPGGAITGSVTIKVSGFTSNAVTFTVKPKIDNVTPTAGPAGTVVTISGSSFGTDKGTSTITFNGTVATPTSWSTINIIAPVPAAATTGPIVVTVGGQASNGVTFTVAPTGAVAGTITRTSDGAAINGALVDALQGGVIKGSTMSAANGSYTLAGVLLGTYDIRVSAPGYQTRIKSGVVLTANATTTVNQSLDPVTSIAPGDIQYVYDELGRLVAAITPTEAATYTYDAVGNLLSILRGSSSQVSIIEFTPNGGAIGTTVTIYGTAFSPTPNQNTVTFNGVAATVTSATATKIGTQVPVGATTGPIVVTTPAGTAASSTPFTVGDSEAPTITGFSPRIGTAGSVVTITGTNFDPSYYNNRVEFNGTPSGGVTAGTSTTISATVPTGAGSGPITVTTPVGTATSSGNFDFIIPPPPYTAADVEVTGRMAIGESKIISITTANKVAIIVFDGAAGQWVSLGFSNTNIGAPFCCDSGTLAIYKPNGTKLMGPFVFVQEMGGGTTPSVQLPTTGTYAIVVDPADTFVGSGTLSLSEDLSPPISINGPPVTLQFTQPGQNSRLFFTGNAGQWVSLGMSDTTISPSGCCDTSTVAIYKPDGTMLLASFQFYQVGNGTPSVQLPVTGTYMIIVDPYNTRSGVVTLTLSEDLSPSISINGPPVTLTNRIGQNARLSFSGTAGQWVSLGITDYNIGAPACCTTSTVAILKPDGTTLLAPLGFFQFQIPTTTQSIQLPETGTYSLLVDPYFAVAGNVTLTFSEDISPPIAINGPPVTLNFNRIGQNSRLTFSGNAGQWVSVGTTDSTISAGGCCASSTVAIYNPDGTTLLAPTTFFTSGGGTPSVQLPVTGNYTIIVEPYNNMFGSVTLHLSEDLSPPIAINGPPVILTNRPGQNARLLFSGTAGQWVSLAATDTTIGAANCCVTSSVAILKPDGTTLLAPLSFFQQGIATQSLQLPVTGTYSIIVDPYNAVAGNVTITLSEDLSAQISINGSPVTLTNRVGQNARLSFNGNAGQWVSLGASDYTIGAPACCTTSTMAILKPDGTTLVAPVGFFGFQSGGGTPSVQLPVTGAYTIVMDPYNTVAGNVTLTLSEDLSPPISINGPPVTLTNRVGQNARLLFSGTAGQWISLGVSDYTIGAPACCTTSTVAILKPDGTTLLAPLGFFGFQPGLSTPSIQLPVTGTYSLLVDPYHGVAGNVTITLSEDLSPPISINGGPVSLNINRVGQNATLTFSGTAGQQVTVRITGNNITGVAVKLLRPDGTELTSTSSSSSSFNLATQTLSTTGTYTIIIDPSGLNTGSLNVSVTNP